MTDNPIASNRLAHQRALHAAAPRLPVEAETPFDEQPAEQPADQPVPTPAQFSGASKVFSVSAVSPAGWPVTFAFADIAIEAFETRLLQISKRGYTPPASDWPTTPEGLPICRKHGVPMKRRERQGDTWHSHNMGSTDQPCYCRGYAGKDSPGWER